MSVTNAMPRQRRASGRMPVRERQADTLSRALEVARRGRDKGAFAATLLRAAYYYQAQRDVERARNCIREALALYLQLFSHDPAQEVALRQVAQIALTFEAVQPREAAEKPREASDRRPRKGWSVRGQASGPCASGIRPS